MQSPRLSFSESGGKTSYWPGHLSVTNESYFDIGSITKVVATASVLARLYDRGEVQPEEKVSDTIKDLKKTALKDATLLNLLTHSAGLKAWLPLYKNPKVFAYAEWVGNVPSQKSVYSDLGFLILGEYLKTKFGSLEDLFEKEVKAPLKLQHTFYNPPKENKNIVATEYCHYRKRMLQGEVFDENTYSLGGVSTHAGLFSRADDLVVWADAWLKAREGKTDWLSQKTASYFTTKLKENWGAGFDTKSSSGSSLGAAFSENTFGHLGYPGTSVWVDPDIDAVVVFLTNRVHPSRLDERIRLIRPRVHELVYEELKEQGVSRG